MRSKPKHRPVPEEIPDADHELVMERVCAIDVAKASGVVCVRTRREHRRVSKVWDVESTTGAVSDLAGQVTFCPSRAVALLPSRTTRARLSLPGPATADGLVEQ